MTGNITRRGFLKGTSAAFALSLLHLRAGKAGGPAAAAGDAAPPSAEPVAYRGFADVYRQRWTWDRIAKGTHYVNCWYQRGCAFDVYVKEGIAWREEQVGTYPQTNPDVPDYNPRGCQKGACYTSRMYDASRVRHPLKRVGARGKGKWKRISWDQALREIGEASFDVITTDGPGSIFFEQGTSYANGAHVVGLYRTREVLDTPLSDLNPECGDHKPGAWATAGKMVFSNSLDDLFYADLILIWGGNPVFTQIPNAHFINEARYKGARVVTIAPDYSASAIHADRWIPIEVGTDAAFALAMAHVLIEEDLVDRSFVAEQTDLPFLVRKDTRRFLRKSDLEKGGDEEIFYVFDAATKKLREAPKKSLALEGIEPALEGEFSVHTKDGEVTVTPVFALLREQLSHYTPEEAAAITGIPPGTVRELAREIARVPTTVLPQANSAKFYHGVEIERAQILLMMLAGQCGKKGSGYISFPYLSLDSPGYLSVVPGSMPPRIGMRWLQLKAMPGALKKKWEGYSDEMIVYDAAREAYIDGGTPSINLWLYFHAGLDELYGRSKEWDPFLKRELDDYLTEALERGWQADPRPLRPRIMIQVGGNLLRRTRGYPKIIENLLPKLDLLVTVDWRMSTTARYSDYVLPVASWYEKDDVTWSTPLSPFAHVTTQAVPPLAESKTDWAFHCLFLKELQKLAVERGIRTFLDRAGKERRLDRVYDEFTFGGRYTESNPEDFLEEVFALNTNLGGVSWPEIKEKGYARFTSLGLGLLQTGNATDIEPNQTITANTWHTEKKLPWPTLTRRVQFFIDHDFYKELGEELPVHKDNPPIGGDHPLALLGPHPRWSIHASWREEPHLLRLNRGQPFVLMGPEDARERKIEEGDRVRVFNDIGSFDLQAKIAPAMRPGSVMVYHAWEPYQFEGWRSHAAVLPAPINPIQLSGGYFHLQPVFATGAPGSPDRGTRVEIERL